MLWLTDQFEEGAEERPNICSPSIHQVDGEEVPVVSEH